METGVKSVFSILMLSFIMLAVNLAAVGVAHAQKGNRFGANSMKKKTEKPAAGATSQAIRGCWKTPEKAECKQAKKAK
jgi:hypothetical protein